MKKKLKRELHCNHMKRGMSTIYTYDLVSSSLHLCSKCEKKLRKEIIAQDKFERKLDKEEKEKRN